jgi:YVTN family beta-propeller protein
LRPNLILPIFPFIFGAAACLLPLSVPSALAETPPSLGTPAIHTPAIHIQKQWNLGGSAGWGPMHVDSPSRLLYVPRTGSIMVINTDSGQIAGEISGFIDAREVALDDQGKFGYATDIMDGTVGLVRVFDRANLKIVSSVPVGRIPSAIVFDPLTKNVFAFSSRDRNVSVIDTKTNTVIATIPLPGKAHIAVTDGRGTIFVGFRGIGKMARIDTAAQKVTESWPVAPCDEFTGLTMDAANRQLLGACVNRKLVSINANSGQVAPIGESAPGTGDLAFDPQNHLLLSAANSGVLTIFHQDAPSQYARVEEVSTMPRAGTLAFDPVQGRAYLVTAKFEQRPVTGEGMEEAASRLTPVPDSIVVLVVGP